MELEKTCKYDHHKILILTERLVSFRTARYSFIKFEPSFNNKAKICSTVLGKTSWGTLIWLKLTLNHQEKYILKDGKKDKTHTWYIPTRTSSLMKGWNLTALGRLSSGVLTCLLLPLTELLWARSADCSFSCIIIGIDQPKEFNQLLK